MNGWIRSTEVTQGAHGWHVHLHVAVIVRESISDREIQALISGSAVILLFLASLFVFLMYVIRRRVAVVPVLGGAVLSVFAVTALLMVPVNGVSQDQMIGYASKHLAEVDNVEQGSSMVSGKMAGYPSSFNCIPEVVESPSKIRIPGLPSTYVVEVGCNI